MMATNKIRTREMFFFDWAMLFMLREKDNFDILEGLSTPQIQTSLTINH